MPVGWGIRMAAGQKPAEAGDEWEAEGTESELRQKVDHRIIELLWLEKSSKIIKSNHQPVQPDVRTHHHLAA